MSKTPEQQSDAELLNWLAEMTEGIQKVYIEPVGWLQLDRKSITKAMKEHRDAAD